MTNDGINTLVYDAENRVTSSTSGSASGTYTYDGNGQRVQKSSGGTTIVTIFLGGQVLAEYNNGAAPSSPTNEYIYAGSLKIASIQSGTTDYWHNDHLSPRVRTDTSGNVADQRGTFPFGESWYSPGASPYMFTSYYRDVEAEGNDYAQARYNVSGLGRFSSPDPVSGSTSDPQSLNRYSYVRNMPVMLTDPFGTCPGGTAQNRDDNQSQDSKGGGPSASDSADSADPDPQQGPPPWNGCKGFTDQGGGGGPTVDGVDLTGVGGLLGDSNSTIPCPSSGCQMDADGNFIGPVYAPNGWYSNYCTGQYGHPTCSGFVFHYHQPGYNGFGLVGQNQSDEQVGLDIWNCPGCHQIWNGASNFVTAATIYTAGGATIAVSAPTVVTVASTTAGWAYGASASGVVALGSQSDTALAAAEDGVSRLNVPNGVYNFLNNMGQWWTFNQAYLDAHSFFGGRFEFVTDPGRVWSGSWYLNEINHLLGR